MPDVPSPAKVNLTNTSSISSSQRGTLTLSIQKNLWCQSFQILNMLGSKRPSAIWPKCTSGTFGGPPVLCIEALWSKMVVTDAFPQIFLLGVSISFSCFKHLVATMCAYESWQRQNIRKGKHKITNSTSQMGSQAVRESSESCGPLNHCSHEVVGGGGELIIWAAPGHKWVMELPSRQVSDCPEMIILLSAGLPPIQFRGVNYRSQILTKGDPIQGSFLSVNIYAATSLS